MQCTKRAWTATIWGARVWREVRRLEVLKSERAAAPNITCIVGILSCALGRRFHANKRQLTAFEKGRIIAEV
jgi:hypothetical protein